MVAVSNKELLSWYVMTLKLNQAVGSGLQNAQSPTNSRPIEFPETTQPQRQENQLPSITGEETGNVEEAHAKPPESEWVISIKEKLDQVQYDDAAGVWKRLSIYRIPKCLREAGDENAYIPQVVSLGPYHHGKRRLRNMEQHKWRALHRVLKRTEKDISLYLHAVEQLEKKARACYEGQICLGSNEFVKMMVLDGCFILELFRGADKGFIEIGYSRSDRIFAMRSTMHSIRRDMIMLENQIPFFILDRLLAIQSGNPDQKGEVARLALRFFDPLMPTAEPLTESDRIKMEMSLRKPSTFDPLTEQDGLHCLQVFRHVLLATRSRPKPTPPVCKDAGNRRQQLVRCVTYLKEAGIKFKKRNTDRFWDIKFKNGVLEIPRILIHDSTRSFFLNLIAFEQCHSNCAKDITSYVIFMDNLINSPTDVSYLHHRGIIEHWLGSDAEVAELFNNLCQEVGFDRKESFLSTLSEQVNGYCEYRWNPWRAILRHRYFSNPWAIISFIAAVVLLVLTFAQTFYSVYGYYRPPS